MTEGAASAWAIGDPGRAAVELPAGSPSPPAGHADIEVSSFSVGAMGGHAASVRGLLHRTMGKPRQDAYALSSRAASDGECLIAVVCDGVGSLGRSHEAAELVSRALARGAAEDEPWPEAVEHANRDLKALAAQAHDGGGGGDEEGMATTAVALAVRLEGDEWIGDLAWIGDSSCWHLDTDGRWSEITRPPLDEEEDDDDYYTGRVAPLPSPDGACEGVSFRLRGGAVFLMSDGVANPMKWSQEVQETLAEWWADAPDGLTFAAQVGFARKTHMDDRTAGGIWPEPQPCRSAESRDERTRAVTVRKPDLGPLDEIALGAFGRVYKAPQFRLPDESDELAYKEFTTDHARQAQSARAVVGLWDRLDANERADLARYAAWPRALVHDPVSRVCGLLMPLLPQEFFAQQPDLTTGQVKNQPREMQWLIATQAQRSAAKLDLPAIGRADRQVILAQLANVLAWLHRRGWVYGGLDFKNVVFALDPPSIKLLDCDGAAPVSAPNRDQTHSPFWEPPECKSGQQRLQDELTDVYKLGLAILRCLTPGTGAATTTDPARLDGTVDEITVELVRRALSEDRAQRPTAEELYMALDGGRG